MTSTHYVQLCTRRSIANFVNLLRRSIFFFFLVTWRIVLIGYRFPTLIGQQTSVVCMDETQGKALVLTPCHISSYSFITISVPPPTQDITCCINFYSYYSIFPGNIKTVIHILTMTYSTAEKRQVFLSCKAIFTGPNASLRKSKAIQKRITEHQDVLSTLISNFEIKRVASIVKALLEKQVFQSNVKAEMEFPDLFAPSPAKEAQHDAIEAEASRSAADILKETTLVYEREDSERTQAPSEPLSVELQVPAKAQVQVKSGINPCKQTSL